MLLGAGYDDDAARYYSWDNTVQLHASPAVGDSIILWDKKYLLGVSVIDVLEISDGEKKRYRCPDCNKTKMQTRKKKPPYWCPECKKGVTNPVMEMIEVTTYKSYHESSWVDLEGKLDGRQLRSLCYKPKSQGSIREIHWDRFQLALGGSLGTSVAKIASSKEKSIPSGHKTRLIKARRGQAEFRKRLVKKYGDTCALSGPAPSDVLDAAHLYSYAERGVHNDLGGLLIRKDLHRLFDLGLITVNPKSLKINVDKTLSNYPIYQSLNGNMIAVEVVDKTKKWIKQHWDCWRGDED